MDPSHATLTEPARAESYVRSSAMVLVPTNSCTCPATFPGLTIPSSRETACDLRRLRSAEPEHTLRAGRRQALGPDSQAEVLVHPLDGGHLQGEEKERGHTHVARSSSRSSKERGCNECEAWCAISCMGPNEQPSQHKGERRGKGTWTTRVLRCGIIYTLRSQPYLSLLPGQSRSSSACHLARS